MNALKRKIILCIRHKLIMVFFATIITLLILPKSMADNSANHLQIGTCRNQNNQISMRVISVEKVKSSLGNNIEFKLEINNYSNQPIRFALSQFGIELPYGMGKNLSFGNQIQNAYLSEKTQIFPIYPMSDAYFPEVQPFGSITFLLFAKVYEENGELHFVFFNYGNFYVVVFRHETDDWLKLLQNNKMYGAIFRYRQLKNLPNIYGIKDLKVCTGDFRTNFVKIDLSAS
jgi:hypothetical protein